MKGFRSFAKGLGGAVLGAGDGTTLDRLSYSLPSLAVRSSQYGKM